MPVSVSCSTCGGKLKAPDKLAGRTVHCPQCGQALVVPAVGEPSPPDVPSRVQADGPSATPQSASLQRPKPPPVEEDVVHGIYAGELIQSGTDAASVPGDAPAIARRAHPAPAADDWEEEVDEPEERSRPSRKRRSKRGRSRDRGGQTIVIQNRNTAVANAGGGAFGLGQASLVLGIAAFLFAWMPCIGIVAIPLAGLGLLLGFIDLMTRRKRHSAGLGLAIGGMAVNFLALAIASVWLMLGSAFLGAFK